MVVLNNIDKNEYEAFILQHSSLFHSLEWGEFTKAYFKVTPHYLGIFNDTKLVGAFLLLQKEIDSNHSYFLIPNDIVFSNENKNLIKNTYSKIIQYVRKEKGILLQQLSKEKLSWKEKKPYINLSIQNEYKSIKLKDYRIDYLKDKIEKENLISIETYKGTKKDLIHLPLNNSINYYETLYDILNNNESTKVSIYIEKLHITTTVNNLDKRIKEINTQISILPIDSLSELAKKKYKQLEEQKKIVNHKLSVYKKLKQKYKNDTILSANLLVEYGKTAWILFDTKKDILEEDITNYNAYLEEIKNCTDDGIEVINAPLNISDDKSSVEKICCYEAIANHILYMWLSNKLK